MATGKVINGKATPRRGSLLYNRSLPSSRTRTLLVAVFSMLGTMCVLASADLVVDEPTEITAATNIANATINADLTVNNVRVLPDSGSTTLLPGVSGKTPRILVTGSSGVYNTGAANTLTMKIGENGGMGCLVVSNSANARVQQFRVEENASDPATPGTNTVLRLESNGMAVIDNGYNYNPDAVARIVFAGGKMRGGNPFRTSGTHWLLESEPGEDIKFIDLALQGTQLTYNDTHKGTVTLKTDRDIVVGDNATSSTSPRTQGKLILNSDTNRIHWAHAGDIVLSNNVQLVIQVGDCLPCGPAHGGIRITKTLSDKDYFVTGREVLPNFYFQTGQTSSCNWIDVQDGFMTNASATTWAVLKMGTWNEDTSFKGHVFGNVRIEKSGTGKITLADAQLPVFKLLSGSAEIAAGKTNALSRIESLKIGPDTALSLLTGDLEHTGDEALFVDSLSVGAGRELRLAGTSDFGVNSFSTEGTLVKTGAGTLDLRVGASEAPKTRVDEGVCRLGGLHTTNRWWRFTFKKALLDSTVCSTGYDAPATETLSIGKIHLFDLPSTDVLSDLTPHLNGGLEEDSEHTGGEDDLSDLEAGKICSSPWFIYSSGSEGGVNSMANGATWRGSSSLVMGMSERGRGWNNCMVFTNKVVRLDDPSTYVTVAFRLKDDGSVIRSYAIAAAPSNGKATVVAATHWKVESSPTGKPGTWVTMDERADEDTTTSVKSADHIYPYYNGRHAYMLRSTTLMRVASFDVSDVSATGTGVVDFSNVPDGVLTSSELTVDFSAGGGAYTKYAFGASGTLNLVNVPENVRLGANTTIPVSLGQVSGSENLRNWTVTVNGVLMPELKLMYKDGSLCFKPNGFVLTFR